MSKRKEQRQTIGSAQGRDSRPDPMERDVISFDTFRDIGAWEIGNLTQKEPSAFNGVVRIRKYRVTVELIDEPIEVIKERIQKLWDECDNHHYWRPIQKEAAKYGMELSHDTRRR